MLDEVTLDMKDCILILDMDKIITKREIYSSLYKHSIWYWEISSSKQSEEHDLGSNIYMSETRYANGTNTRFIFNKIAIQARSQMATDKKAVGLSRVHMYEYKCNLSLRDNCLFCS